MTLPQLVVSLSTPRFSNDLLSSNIISSGSVGVITLPLLVVSLSPHIGQHYFLLLAVTVLILLTSTESLLYSEECHCVITVQGTPAITADHTLTFAVTTLLALLVTAHHGLYSTLYF